MKKSFYLILIPLFIFFGKSSAQFSNDPIILELSFIQPSTRTINYLPLSNYHFFNPYYFNPAMAGIEDKKQLNVNWNRQFEHAYRVSYEQPIPSINSAAGIFVSTTSQSNTSIRSYGLAYNYGFNLKSDMKLKFGFQFSQTHFSLKQNFSGERKKRWFSAPALDFGAAFQAKQLRLGVSIQNLFPVKINPDYYYRDVINGRRQINVSAANTFKLSKHWDWSFAILLRFYDDNDELYEKPFSVNDHSSYFSFRKNYFFGVTGRINEKSDDAFILFLGLKTDENMNFQFSFNAKKDEQEDRRFFEALVQYQFKK